MLEAMLTKKKPQFSAATGISIEGFTGTPTMSAGVTKTGDTYSFSDAAVNYIRIPYAGTPSPSAENSEVICSFMIETLTNARLILFARYKQGQDPPSWLVSIAKSGQLEFSYNNLAAAVSTNAKVAFGVEQKIVLRRSGDNYFLYLNDVLALTLTYAGSRAAAWDWTLGSYLNGSNNIITATYAFPVKWKLFGFSAKKI